MKTTNKTKGFSIIEVVLVLAIAGLIFLMVFLALPALQRSQRDTQRRDDVGRVISAVQSYKTNNNGRVPAANGLNAAFISSYLTAGGSSFVDPSGGDYSFVERAIAGGQTPAANGTASNTTNGQVSVYRSVRCDGTAANNALSVVIQLESGGVYCANS